MNSCQIGPSPACNGTPDESTTPCRKSCEKYFSSAEQSSGVRLQTVTRVFHGKSLELVTHLRHQEQSCDSDKNHRYETPPTDNVEQNDLWVERSRLACHKLSFPGMKVEYMAGILWHLRTHRLRIHSGFRILES